LPTGVVRYHLSQEESVQLARLLQILAHLAGGPLHQRSILSSCLEFVWPVVAKILNDDGVTGLINLQGG